VDAAIGGKTGVNLDGVKNMLGVIRQPEFILTCPEYLATIPEREFLSGAAEMLKTFLLFSASDYRVAVENLEKIHIGETDLVENQILVDLIEKAAGFKKEIVAKDPFEKDIRRILNLGHTYGHAIEWWQKEKLFTHGEAVAIGIVKAARISEERGIAQPGLAAGIADDFRLCGLPTELPCPEAELSPAINQDKKCADGHLHMILLSDIGAPVID